MSEAPEGVHLRRGTPVACLRQASAEELRGFEILSALDNELTAGVERLQGHLRESSKAGAARRAGERWKRQGANRVHSFRVRFLSYWRSVSVCCARARVRSAGTNRINIRTLIILRLQVLYPVARCSCFCLNRTTVLTRRPLPGVVGTVWPAGQTCQSDYLGPNRSN